MRPNSVGATPKKSDILLMGVAIRGLYIVELLYQNVYKQTVDYKLQTVNWCLQKMSKFSFD